MTKQKAGLGQAQMSKLKCQMNAKIQMTNQTARPGQGQMTKPKCQTKFKCQMNAEIQMTIGPPHSNSLPPGERESLDEIATGFALATTSSDCHVLQWKDSQ